MEKARAWHLLLRQTRRSDRLTTTIPKMDLSERYCFNPILQWNPEVENYFIKAYCTDHFSCISKALTRPSRYACIRINTLKSTTDDVIKKLLKIMEENGFVDECSDEAGFGLTGAARIPLQEGLKNCPVFKCQIPGLDYVVFVNGSGPHTIDYGCMPGAPPLKEVIVSRKCAEAVLRAAQVFVPGVMACSAHVEKGDTVAVSVAMEQSNPAGRWAIGMTRGTVLQGPQTDPYYFERNGLYIGQGTTMMSRAGFFCVSEGIAVDMNNRVFKLPSFHEVLEGEIFLQNLPSIVTAHVLDPQKGERILDMCAAPGGKTTAIAILMKDDGEVVAADRSHNKVLDIQKLAAEMSLTSSNEIENGRTYASKDDVRKNKRRLQNGPGRNQHLGGRVENSKGFYPDSFDRVLLDAPCSALGLRPRLFAGEETLHSLRKHAKYQRRMFDQAVKLVRPGGVVVYSTCTINPEGSNPAVTSRSDVPHSSSNGITEGIILPITGHKLNGQNYIQWAQSVRLFICGRGKEEYLTGTTQPQAYDPGYRTWRLENSMVMSWLINSMTNDIGENFMYYGTTKEMWEAARETYSNIDNTSAIFEIKRILHDLRQEDGLQFRRIVEKERIYKFLLGLNRNLDEVRANVLSIKPLLSVREIFSEIHREESRQRVMMGGQSAPRNAETSALVANRTQSGNTNHTKKNRPWCEYCKKLGHVKEDCWNLHEKPADWKPSKPPQIKGSRGYTAVMEEDTTSVVSNSPFSKEQLEALQKLFQQTLQSAGVSMGSESVAQKGLANWEEDWQC